LNSILRKIQLAVTSPCEFRAKYSGLGKEMFDQLLRPFGAFARILTLGMTLLAMAQNCVAQLPASPPIADPADHRFAGVTEVWTTPSLTGSNLTPAAPVAFVDDSPAGYTVELIQVQWRWGDPIDLYLIKPKGIKSPPVIVNLYGYPEDTDPYKNEIFQKALIKDGVAAVGFVSALTGQRYHDRPMKQWFLSELQESLAVSAHDVQLVLDYLAGRGDLDMTRVGMFGQGSGASIAVLASAADPRIKVLDILDPWGDWPTWMATSPFVPEEERSDYVKPEFLKNAAALEPLDWLTKIQAKKFRLQQLIFETDTPKPIKEKIRAAVPQGTTVTLYQTLAEFKTAFPSSTNLQWVEQELRSLPAQPAVPIPRRSAGP
jgi:hypothetical protein